MSNPPVFDKNVTQIAHLKKRIKKFFPDLKVLIAKDSGDLYLVVAALDNQGNPILKIACHHFYKLYLTDIETWNFMLECIHNNFTFPGDDNWACPQCRCPHIDLVSKWSGAKCTNCGKEFGFWLKEDY